MLLLGLEIYANAQFVYQDTSEMVVVTASVTMDVSMLLLVFAHACSTLTLT